MTEHVEGQLAGRDGLSLYWQGWRPADEPRAVVAIAHGAFEHSGRYAHVAESLGRAGIACHALDHRGHGRSEGARGNVGRMAHLVADLDVLIALAVARHPGRPLFLLGHSMGGAIALQYAVEHPARLAGLIVSGAAVDVSAVSPVQFWSAKALSVVAPDLGLLRIDSGEISRDPDVVHAYDEDPLVYRGKGPARSIAEILTTAKRLPHRVRDLRVPLLIVHGTEDRLAAPSGSRMVHDAAASGDKTLKLYDGLYHEVLNEPEKDTVIGDVIAWLVARS